MKNYKNAAHVLFFRPVRYDVMATLAVNGPLTVRELSRAIGKDSSGVFVLVESLIKAGILYKSDKPGHRKYVALDKRYFAFEELKALLLKLDEKYPVKRTDTPAFRTSFPSRRTRRKERSEGAPEVLFGVRGRSWALIVMRAAESLSRRQMSRLLNVSITGAQGIVDALVGSKIAVRAGRTGLSKPVYLNRNWFAAQELGALLDRLYDGDVMFSGITAAAITTGSQEMPLPKNVVDLGAYRRRQRLAS